MTGEVLQAAFEHLRLVATAMLLAVLIGVPLGVLLTRRARLAGPVLGLASVLQTVPSLALIGLLIPVPFIGGLNPRTAILALVVYALLPVVRNTYVGIRAVDPSVHDAAVGMGMSDRQLLALVELPLAAPTILAGIRIAAVVSVGIATVAAAIGAGGLGRFIFRGLAMVDERLILAGALPAAALALALDLTLGRLERALAPESRRRRSPPPSSAVLVLALPLALALAAGCGRGGDRSQARVVVGSKNFTESILLGEVLAQAIEAGTEAAVERKLDLGGSFVCDKAIRAGEIDVYPEYTGTALAAILKLEATTDRAAVRQVVESTYAQAGLVWTEGLGFENTFAILVRGEDARQLKLATISDAVGKARSWRGGFGYEFESRADGLAGLKRAYGLELASVRTMDLGLTYRALAAREVDLIAGNSTDGLIAKLDLVQLGDDRGYFPPYEAAPIVRRDALERVPGLRVALAALAGRLSAEDMRRANFAIDGEKRPVAEVARELLRGKGLVR